MSNLAKAAKRKFTDGEKMAHVCAACGATPFNPCRDSAGKKLRASHSDRRDAAVRQWFNYLERTEVR